MMCVSFNLHLTVPFRWLFFPSYANQFWKHVCAVRYYQKAESYRPAVESMHLSSKDIRKHFLDFFVLDKKHTYVHSSPVFLNSDPSLLFVNAGMNQFRSLLLGKMSSDHGFSNLRRAANSQKCIRLSGKHNDLEDVGHDFHHHTFFEMLGNWSFGDYFKEEACQMAWEFLTKVLKLPKDRLYITYFGGDLKLNLPPDEECLNIWQNLGVSSDHIFPFNAKENFWEMGKVGPCGPCTEIHFDYIGNTTGSSEASKRINSGRSDLIEIWNLVFVMYNRKQCGTLETLPTYHVDTGMGLERITAVLQGTMSNYDTDIFRPIFKVIEQNFRVRPYEGKIGSNDIDGIDTAYRIIADHARMFTVAISDGLFPDNYDAGHVLRKIIRRAAYLSNRVMKTPPGVLSTLVPYVVENLDFFPELKKQCNEVIEIVNEEEKMLHRLINKGRKARNKMLSEKQILEGKDIWKLHEVYGLDKMIIQDITSEVNAAVDWDGYYTLLKDKEKSDRCVISKNYEGNTLSQEIVKMLQASDLPHTNDTYKYDYEVNKYVVKDISSEVISIIKDNCLINDAAKGSHCIVITDETNFYSVAGGQASDIGKIIGKNFIFQVEKVHFLSGYVFHCGKVVEGIMHKNCDVQMFIDQHCRQKCMCNHTATHLVNCALRTIFPYMAQKSSYVGPDCLRFGFNAKAALSVDQISYIEKFVNQLIAKNLVIFRTVMSLEEVMSMKNAIFLPGEEYPEQISVISIGEGNDPSQIISIEPCCGTHVFKTSDIKNFAIMSSKSSGGTLRTITAVTGNVAQQNFQKGIYFEKQIDELEHKVNDINHSYVNPDELTLLLKNVKSFLNECHQKTDVPLLILKKCEERLKDLKLKLTDWTGAEDNNVESNTILASSDIANKTLDMCNILSNNRIPLTLDFHKYELASSHEYGVTPLLASILAIFQNNTLVENIQCGQHCIVVTDKTNFYSALDEQIGDKGLISSKDFVFEVSDVYKSNGYVFHEGWVKQGVLHNNQVQLNVDEIHRRNCSLNHTALHLLNAVLQKFLPYSYQHSAFVGPTHLYLYFTSKRALLLNELYEVENTVNEIIQQKIDVIRKEVPAEQLKNVPNISLPPIVKFQNTVPVISIDANKCMVPVVSVEPCFGTHAHNTFDISKFILTSYKSDKNLKRYVSAVTGNEAKNVSKCGEQLIKDRTDIEEKVLSCLKSENPDYLEMWDLLNIVKKAKVVNESTVPLLIFRDYQSKLTELTKCLYSCTEKFVQDGFANIKSEMEEVLKKHSNEKFIIHNISSIGDGKKIINVALSCVTDKPSMFFSKDGHKTIICSCHVPKNYISSSFTALLWMTPVATFLKGHTRILSKDPEQFYSVSSNEVHKVNEAIKIAHEFIHSCTLNHQA